MARSRCERRRARSVDVRGHAVQPVRPLTRIVWSITTRERDLTDRPYSFSAGPDVEALDVRRRSRGGALGASPSDERQARGTACASRRDVLKLGAVIAAGGAVAPLLAACAAPGGTGAASVAPSAGGSAARRPPATTAGPCPVPSRS